MGAKKGGGLRRKLIAAARRRQKRAESKAMETNLEWKKQMARELFFYGPGVSMKKHPEDAAYLRRIDNALLSAEFWKTIRYYLHHPKLRKRAIRRKTKQLSPSFGEAGAEKVNRVAVEMLPIWGAAFAAEAKRTGKKQWAAVDEFWRTYIEMQ